MDAFEPSPPPQPKSRAKTCLIVALIAAGVGILLCAGLGGGIFYVVVRGFKNMAPYQISLERVQQSPEVIERLGEPIEDATWMPTAQVSVTNDQGSATIDFKVQGPKGEAHVRTQARLIDGVWGLTQLTVTFADGKRVELAAGSGGEQEEAPKWTPPGAGPLRQEAPEGASPAPQIELKLPDDVPLPEGAPGGRQ